MVRRVSNPPNPWERTQVEWLGEPPVATLEIYEEECRTALSGNDSPDLTMRWSVNPYRGCFHGCAYCYARRSHQYLGYGAGTDFERRIVVKTNIAARLRVELQKPGWRGDTIVFSGNTDCYQPVEAVYRLTRSCLEVCRDLDNPVSLITKGALIRRDLDLLAELAQRGRVRVFVSIAFDDDAMARRIEPFTSLPSQRFETLQLLSEAGVATGISLAPCIPGLNDGDIPRLLERAHRAGARQAFLSLVRLPGEVQPVFVQRLREAFPARAEKVLGALRELRGGNLGESRFGLRMHGEGPRWELIERMFTLHCRRLGLTRRATPEQLAPPSVERRRHGQALLFDPPA